MPLQARKTKLFYSARVWGIDLADLQVLVGYLQYICDIERAMLGTAGFIHELSVHVTR